MSDKSLDLRDLGHRFRQLRRELKITQKVLSTRAGVSRDTIHRLERGGAIDLSSLTALLNALGYQVAFEPRAMLRAADVRRLFAHVHSEGD